MRSWTPNFAIDRARSQSFHAQICAGFRAAITAGQLCAGDPVPSTRQLARDLGLSRMPVLTAYAQLIAEGYFETRPAAATRVARALPAHAAPAASLPPARRLRLARRVSVLPRYQRPPWVGPTPVNAAFAVHRPALDQFPYALWARLVRRHARRPSSASVTGLHPMGVERTREAIAHYLRTTRGVRCEAAQVMLVSGSQQALDLCARVLCNPGGRVWMEEPGYWLAREAFLSAGCRLNLAPVDAEGLNVARAARRPSSARMAYVTPAHQYPLGATLSAARRLQLLQWAVRAQAWVLEDDYDGEFRYDAQPIAALHALDHHARVIYIGTFSKVMFPSLRLGYLVLPADLVDAFIAVRRAADLAPGELLQQAIADFIIEGHFARHIQRMRRLYRERRSALVAALAVQLPQWQIHGAGSGLHLTITPPHPLDDVAMATHAAANGLRLWPLSPAYARPPRRPGFILGFGSVLAADMPREVARLSAELDRSWHG